MATKETTTAAPAAAATTTAGPVLGKSGKKICCSCPETKKERDLCVVTNGEDLCKDIIEKHKACLRSEGFTVNVTSLNDNWQQLQHVHASLAATR